MSDKENIIVIRKGTAKDVSIILELIKALADYEKAPHEVIADEKLLTQNLFGDKPYAETLIADYDGEPAGFALFFHNFSTWVGKPGIYLEDLFVKPHLRGKGIGKKLLIQIAKIAVERDCGRFEWAVLDWNEPSIQFYKNLGAKPMDEWTIFRMTEQQIKVLADIVD
ncbi:MAG: GNAT family N-acetyltransferase [Melioribacteraceae bacterium]|jgi:GNAT superfamily N-acetyltransferase|nr:GNAT family N-acetyltransferase [Melioribacteraceae bacterium]RJP61367.1 MAG: GNAT family N-acetyltransferase [Ignavibacteriales bacterium]